jgi:hypothetical protein
MTTQLASRTASANASNQSVASGLLSQKTYQVAQQVEYLYLEAEIDVLLRQLQSLKSQKVSS